jgi:uncharacterized protein YifN (PemK superfamily)
MPLSKLSCPRDPSHSYFRGEIRTFSRYDVELDSDRNELRRANPTDFIDVSEPSDERISCATCNTEVWSKRRVITFFPPEGTVLLCDFTGGFRPPEMIEVRPTIVISKKSTNRGTCVVVPISSKESRDDRAIVVPIQMAKYPFLRKDGWAKCHAPATVSVTRLYLLRDAQTGRSLDTRGTTIDADDLAAVRNGVARFIGAVSPVP